MVHLTLFFIITDAVDYTTDLAGNTGKLNQSISATCFRITTVGDNIVEGNEEFKIRFSIVDKFGSFVESHGGNTSTVVIADNDCK